MDKYDIELLGEFNEFHEKFDAPQEDNPHKVFDEIGDELDKRGLFWVDEKTAEEINEFIIETRINEFAAKLHRAHSE